MGKVITGTQFNELYKCKFYKVINIEKCEFYKIINMETNDRVLTELKIEEQDRLYKAINNGIIPHRHSYKNGLNIDQRPFTEDTIYIVKKEDSEYKYQHRNSGGFYFTDLNNLGYWIDDTKGKKKYIVEVEVPNCDETSVYIGLKSFKASKLIIHIDTPNKKWDISKFPFWKNETFCIQAVKQNGLLLRFMITKNPEIIENAILENGMALEFVNEEIIDRSIRTEFMDKIRILATKHSAEAIKFVKNKESIIECIKNNGRVLEHIFNQSDDIVETAVKHNGLTLCFVKNQTDNIIELAMKQNLNSSIYIRDKEKKSVIEKKMGIPMSEKKNLNKNIEKDLTENIMKGIDFKNMYGKNNKFYKIFDNHISTHEDNVIINQNSNQTLLSCMPIGLYFIELKNIGMWLGYKSNMKYIVPVEIPDDAMVTVKNTKFYSTELIIDIKNKCEIQNFPFWENVEFCKLSLEQNGCVLKYIHSKLHNYELSKIAVNNEGLSLKYVKSEYYTTELEEIAVSNQYVALLYLREQNQRLIDLAINANFLSVIFIKNKALQENIIKMRVNQDPHLIEKYTQLIDEINRDLLFLNQTEEKCKAIVKYKGRLISKIESKYQTEEICKIALENDIGARQFIKPENWTRSLDKLFGELWNRSNQINLIE